jgi:hypothetical protein
MGHFFWVSGVLIVAKFEIFKYPSLFPFLCHTHIREFNCAAKGSWNSYCSGPFGFNFFEDLSSDVYNFRPRCLPLRLSTVRFGRFRAKKAKTDEQPMTIIMTHFRPQHCASSLGADCDG